EEASELEPHLTATSGNTALIQESSVDPRGVMSAILRSLKHRGVDLAHGNPATRVARTQDGSFEVYAARSKYLARAVVNCCGAWAGEIEGFAPVPARARKGQMLSVIPKTPSLLHHVIRSEEIYLVPRSDGRV